MMATWRPEIIEDRQRVDELMASGRVWEVSDTLEAQLRDLARARHPGQDIEEILAGVPLAQYGRWVYYPWSGRLVRLLPPAEFRELRLDRNRPKVSSDEMARLAGFTVGIAGLSVGNAVALTLALEGTVGHLRLVDFDTLELSNMNRIRAGVHDIGQAKTVLAARQIAEFDPYVGISVMDGVGPENIEEFLLGGPDLGPPLDAVIDECDALSVKFLLRQRARSHGLPVLMETSDRGMLDVERFDLEPDRPLFHGLTGDTADVEDGGFNDGDDEAKARKAAVALRLLDPQRISTNLAASFVEMGTTISSWPQLASDVVLGGASMTAAIRGLALGAPMPSGRRYLDLEANVRAATMEPVTLPSARPARPAGSAEPIPADVRYLVSHAVLAPSGGNSQPWRFFWGAGRIWVTQDREHGQNLMDPHAHAVHLALGAAVENMVVAGAARGLSVDVELFPSDDVAASLAIRPGAAVSDALMPALLRRRTHRAAGARSVLTADEISALTADARIDLYTDGSALAELGRIIGACDRIRFLNPYLHSELVGELRFDSADAPDGITIDSLALPPGFAEALRVIARPDVAARLRQLGGGARLEEGARDSVDGASAMALLSVRDDAPLSWLEGGRTMQRMWLRAEQLGLGVHPMTTAIYMFAMLGSPAAAVFNAAEAAELHELRTRFHKVMPPPDGPAALLFRVTRITGPAVPSSRLPVESVLSLGLPPGHHAG